MFGSCELVDRPEVPTIMLLERDGPMAKAHNPSPTVSSRGQLHRLKVWSEGKDDDPGLVTTT